MTWTTRDTAQSWLVCLIPRRVCVWLWEREVPLGSWTPHVLGRMIGRNAVRLEKED